MRWIVILIAGVVGAGGGHFAAQHLSTGRTTYSVRVVTNPSGAFAYVDGRLLTSEAGAPVSTPLEVTGLTDERTHELTIRKDGFTAYRSPLDIQKAEHVVALVRE